MIKKLLPLVLLLVGVGAGVGAGVFLRPDAIGDPAAVDTADDDAGTVEEDHREKTAVSEHADSEHEKVGTTEFAKLSNQFVVPIVKGDRVIALVVLALSIEVSEGMTETVSLREPKLRDSFLQILFDHANVGGFEGNFTDTQVLGRLRAALKEVAERDLGKDIARDVLIVEIARQDY
jgi:hypothetical protein